MVRNLSVLNIGFPDDRFQRVKQIVLRKAFSLYGISEGEDYTVTLKLTSDIAADAYRIAWQIKHCRMRTTIFAKNAKSIFANLKRFITLTETRIFGCLLPRAKPSKTISE